MTQQSLLCLEILDIMSKKGITQRIDLPTLTNCRIAMIDKALRELVELDIINIIRGVGYIITEDTTAFDVMMMIEETAVMVEDNEYKVDDSNLTTIIRGYSKLSEELKTIKFNRTPVEAIRNYEKPKRKYRTTKPMADM